MLKLKLKDNHIYYLVVIIIFFLVCIISTLKYRDGEIDYHNSDATWHTLLTVTAYNETPIYEHLFLPIVSLGGIDDKDIKWGETIPDEKGNYYYTSFSPAGYFAPWLFLKITNLPVNEQGLYIFNTFLFGSSAILLIYLLSLIYHEEKHYPFISLIGGLCYISAPEILHNMGIVYWHQSLLQVMLILQTIMYYKYINEKSNFSKYLFYGLSIINPYIEWTGYIANIGFAIAEFIRYWNIDKRKGLKNVFCLAILTMLSFELFSIHYLTRVDSITFLTALKNRFLSRSAGAAIELATLFGSYFKSFLYVWVILIISLIFCFIKNKQLELKHGLIFLVLSFPILENIIMKGHAFAYSYDRMKAILLLVLLICEITRNIIASKKIKNAAIIMLIITVVGGIMNINSYIKDKTYIWAIDYRQDNQILANYILNKYPDALYASDGYIRGYMNLLFRKGIYETLDKDEAKVLADKKLKENIVFITQNEENLKKLEIAKIDEINVYNVSNKTTVKYEIINHNVQIIDK